MNDQSAQAIGQRAVRMLAFVDLAKLIHASGGQSMPGEGESTDGDDKMKALLRALQNELEELHAEVSHV